MEIKKVAVLGSGVMGAAIAAVVANSGTPVVLLDIVPEGAEDRSALTKGAVERMLKADPSPFTHPDRAKLVTAGNLEDNLDSLKDVDWIIEAVLERLDVKQNVYRKIAPHRKPGSVVSSNTSTIPLHTLTEGVEGLDKDFLIAHFFNPPRFLRLLEFVPGKITRKEAVDAVRKFADVNLGRGIVDCKDTPGFIANRIGCFWLVAGMNEAFNLGLTVEEADAIMGKPVGIPKTAVFGLYDLIGIDLMTLIAKSFLSTLKPGDEYLNIYKEQPLVAKMIADGYTGRKGKGGFNRMRKDGDKKIMEAIDLASGEYRALQEVTLESVKAAKNGLNALVTHPDKGGQYAWRVLSQTLAYAASLVPEIADDISAVDEAMRLGYAWGAGPFEMIDRMGPAGTNGAKWFADKLASEGRPVPEILKKAGDQPLYRTDGGKRQFINTSGKYQDFPAVPGIWQLADIKLKSKPITGNKSASLWDIGDGIACLEFHSKMNAIDEGIVEMLEKSVDAVKSGFKGLVIGNDADNFSVGANLNFFLESARAGELSKIEDIISRGQNAMMGLKYAPFPVIAALAGMALGGGCEVTLNSNHIQAHIESYPGLVEAKVGLIPAWGGCKEMVLRFAGEGEAGLSKVFEMICTSRTAKSADDARDMRILQSCCGVTMHRLRLLEDAKQKCLSLASGYKADAEAKVKLPGKAFSDKLSAQVDEMAASGKASPQDVVIFKHAAVILAGGNGGEVTERGLLDLEREAFMALVATAPSQDRIEHMLKTGKPLRN